MSDRFEEEELRREFERVVSPDVFVLPKSLLDWWSSKFVNRFVADPSRTWWWEALSGTPVVVSYGDDIDGLKLMSEDSKLWGPSVLLATDESPWPNAGLLGFPKDIYLLLEEVRNFEFVLFDLKNDSYIFDTHRNLYYLSQTSEFQR